MSTLEIEMVDEAEKSTLEIEIMDIHEWEAEESPVNREEERK